MSEASHGTHEFYRWRAAIHPAPDRRAGWFDETTALHPPPAVAAEDRETMGDAHSDQ